MEKMGVPGENQRPVASHCCQKESVDDLLNEIKI
jgi:hypothetical protein